MSWVLLFFAWMYGGWLLFIIYAGVAAKWNALPHPLRWLFIPVGIFGGLLDVSFNLTIATLLFLELPTTWTLTARMAKNKAGPDGWRKDVSAWVCKNMLDVFQAGHC
jgi:hypothetical protein